MKRGTVNQIANRIMKKHCIDNGITRCELCNSDYHLTFAHRHKRRDYYSKPTWLLSDKNQFLLLCLKCHQDIEYDMKKTKSVFYNKRGKDLFDEQI